MATQRQLGQHRPESDFTHITAHVERMWAQLVRGNLNQSRFNPTVIEPPVDVYQTESEVVVVVEIPGVRGQEVELEVDGDRLTVRGEKSGRACPTEHSYSQLEIACGQFERSVRLPAEVDPQGTTLSYEDGFIEIRMPRTTRRQERLIKITLRQS